MSEMDLQKIFEKVLIMIELQAHFDSESLSQLLEIGRTQGFQTTINRRIIWPFLLKVDDKHSAF